MKIRSRFALVLSLCYISNLYAEGLYTHAKLIALKDKFSHENTEMQIFRADAMMNKYYVLKREKKAYSEDYLMQIMYLFPNYMKAKVAYATVLEEKGLYAQAYNYLSIVKEKTSDPDVIHEWNKLSKLQDETRALNNSVLKLPNDNKKTQLSSANIEKNIATLGDDFKYGKAVKLTEEKNNTVFADEYATKLNHYYDLKKNHEDGCAYLITMQKPNIEAAIVKNNCVNDNKSNHSSFDIVSTACKNIYSYCLETGYCLLNAKKSRASEEYFLEAQKIYPQNYKIAMQLGYIENGLNDNKAAYKQFQLATRSTEKDIHNQAENSLTNLSDYKFKYIPEPWYFDLYTEPYYYSRFSDFIMPMQARFGVMPGTSKQYDIYLNYRRSTDTASASGNVGIAPQIYNDNFEIFGAGFRYFPIKNKPLFFYSEYGLAHTLIEGTTYPNTEQDYRGGAIYGNRWGADPEYNRGIVWEFKPWADTYDNISYYTRYVNWIGQITGRAAARVFRWQHLSVSTYVKAQTFFDSQRLFYNNVIEYGPGIQIHPYNVINFSVSYEHLFGNYIPVPNSTNPYGPKYDTNIIRAVFYIKL